MRKFETAEMGMKCAHPRCPLAGQINEGDQIRRAGNGDTYHQNCYEAFKPDLALGVSSMPVGKKCELCTKAIEHRSRGMQILATRKYRHRSCHLDVLPKDGISKHATLVRIFDAERIRQESSLVHA